MARRPAMLTARSHTKHRIEALGRLPLFRVCTRDQLARIDHLGTQLDVRAGRVLMRQGDGARECLVTLDGSAIAFRAGEPLGVIGPGSIAGEMALLDATTRNATVVAETPMCLLVLDPSEFANLLTIAPRIETVIERIAEQRRRAVNSAHSCVIPSMK
jgi:CRP-like cAMP-binding protein